MENTRKKILKFIVLILIFFVIVLIAKNSFAATKKPLKALNVTLNKSSYIYTGNAINPVPTVKYNSKTLTKNKDYTVSYAHNLKAGTASVTITGKGDYTGKVTKSFTINKLDISKSSLSLTKSVFTYDGLEKRPQIKSVKVKNAAGNLVSVSSSNYTVSYKNNVNAGTASVIITGKGNYTGKVTKFFTINKIDISKSNVSLAKSVFTYDGLEKRPQIKSVKIKNEAGNLVAVNSSNYTVSYRNNKNIGTASVTITGKGNYTGKVTTNFTINKINIQTAQVELENTTFTYDGSEKRPQIKSVKVKNETGNLMSINASNYTVSYTNNIKAGTASVLITGKGNLIGNKTVTFKINKVPMHTVAYVELSENTFTYDGSEKKPKIKKVQMINASKKLVSVPSNNYTVIYTNNINAGTASAIIIGKENFMGEKVVTFTIKKKTMAATDIILTNDKFTYNGTEIKPGIKKVEMRNSLGKMVSLNPKNFTLSYTNNINAGTASAVITGKNFEGSQTLNFNIKKAPITKCSITVSDGYYFEGTPVETEIDIKINGIRVEDTNYSLVYENNLKVGTGSVTITGKGNFKGSVKKNFTIKEPPKASVENKTGIGYSKITKIANKTYKIYNQGLFPGTIPGSGCNITAEAIVMSGYGKNLTPLDIAKDVNWAIPRTISQIANDLNGYGIPCSYESLKKHQIQEAQKDSVIDATTEKIRNHLLRGKPIIMLVHQGLNERYTTDAHYIVLVGMDTNGNPAVADPNSGRYRNETNLRDLIKYCMYYNSNNGERGYVLIH